MLTRSRPSPAPRCPVSGRGRSPREAAHPLGRHLASTQRSPKGSGPAGGGGGAGGWKLGYPGDGCATFAGAQGGPLGASHPPLFASLRAPGRGDGGTGTNRRRHFGGSARTSCATGGPGPAARLDRVVCRPAEASAPAGGTGASRLGRGGRLLWGAC